jgi:hypothetical protein
MPEQPSQRPLGWFRWTRHSSLLLGGFILLAGLIVYVWWPLAEEVLSYIDWQGQWWRQIDWLLIGVFLFMSVMIVAGADLKQDGLIVLVGFAGGMVIESWGTQTSLWWYYTAERPPLWIIPAWPIASLTIDRLVRVLNSIIPERTGRRFFAPVYWLIFAPFTALMLIFIWPTLDKSLTVAALVLSLLLIASPKDYRIPALTFIAGSGLGYFLELWGTTRQCWTYYTLQTPPFFAVLAHGMAAVAFWRVACLLAMLAGQIRTARQKARGAEKAEALTR